MNTVDQTLVSQPHLESPSLLLGLLDLIPSLHRTNQVTQVSSGTSKGGKIQAGVASEEIGWLTQVPRQISRLRVIPGVTHVLGAKALGGLVEVADLTHGSRIDEAAGLSDFSVGNSEL